MMGQLRPSRTSKLLLVEREPPSLLDPVTALALGIQGVRPTHAQLGALLASVMNLQGAQLGVGEVRQRPASEVLP